MHNTAQGMLDNALSARHTHSTPAAKITTSLSLFDPRWHQGVIGILASRLKERLHRPVIAFAPGTEGELKGSGRSIPGLHLRDSLDLVSKRYPGLLLKFGGHAAAAGMTIRTGDLEKFREAFEEVARAMLTPADLQHVIETDGDLDEAEMNLELARQIGDQVWGQGFAQPTFITRFQVQDQRVLAEKHLKLKLRRRPASAVSGEQKPSRTDSSYEAILFAHNSPLPEVIDAVYRVQVNEFKGSSTLQLVLDHWFQSDALNP
jgi:single-stranded-DNA-specific exonuclease